MSYISIKNLSVAYKTNKTLPIVRIKDLNFAKGEIIGFFGPNHVGKSTLLKCISQIHNDVSLQKDSILYDGKIYNKKSSEPIIIHVPQDYNSVLLPWFTIHENLRIIMKGLKYTNKDIDSKISALCLSFHMETEKELFEYFGFYKQEKGVNVLKKIDDLSGGQKQILVILRSLVVKPNILTMDEPFSAIDTFIKGKNLRKEIFNYLSQHNITTFIVSHELNELIKFSDKILIFNYSNSGDILKGIEICNNIEENMINRRSIKIKKQYKLGDIKDEPYSEF